MNAFLLVAPVLAVLIAVATWVDLVMRFVRASIASRFPRSSAAQAMGALTPWIAGLVTCVAVLAPSWAAPCHCAEHGLHHPHFCPAHPLLAMPLLWPALAIITAWAVAAAPRLAALVRDVSTTTHWRRQVITLPAQRIRGVDVRFGHCGGLGAVTVGAWRPLIVVDEALAQALRPDELEAIVLHEHQHARRRDPLTLLVLRLGDALLPWAGTRAFITEWRTAAELDCDHRAARHLGDGTVVASALLVAERFRATTAGPLLPASTMAVSGGVNLERRIHALLDDRAKPAPALNDLAASAVLACLLGLLVVLLPTDVAHHAVETLVGFALGHG